VYHPAGALNDPDFADQYAHQLIQIDRCLGHLDGQSGRRGGGAWALGVDVIHPDLKDNIWLKRR
jgi:hypothetical protein